jgi:hypothetical protein
MHFSDARQAHERIVQVAAYASRSKVSITRTWLAMRPQLA